MLLINIFVFPIAMGGLLKGYSVNEADTFVLALPLMAGQKWLSVLVFLGGASAATGMIMISSNTVGTMVTNHLVLPALGWFGQLTFLRRHLLKLRWAAVALVISIGYWFEQQVGESYMLVNIGMIAFAACLQFAPVTLGGIFWRRGNEVGALWGLGAGFLVWFYTLLLPALARSGWISDTVLKTGPWGIGFLNPEGLLGVTHLEPLPHTVFWSLLFNVVFYTIGSLLSGQSKEEQSLAEQFVGVLTTEPALRRTGKRAPNIDVRQKRTMIESMLGQYFGDREAAATTEKCIVASGITRKDLISIIELARLHNEVEKTLAGSVGAAAAHRALDEAAIFTDAEARELSGVYAEILAGLKLNPQELERKIDYYQEREALLTQHALELEQKVSQRTQDLEVAQSELIKREKLSVLGQLTATVSHELRNPLAVISSSVFYVSRRIANADEKIWKHLKRIEEQVHLCDSIIGELLEYTRGRKSAAVEGEINPCLEEVLDEISVPDGVTIVRGLSPLLPAVQFDREKMRRVIINLVENAFQAVAAREGSAREERIPYIPFIRVSTFSAGTQITIRVEDNGIGMNKETEFRAFEPLFTTRARGTGLGLAIVRKIVEEHGGSVTLISRPNEGTTVEVHICTEPPTGARSVS
jgi:signal transduction histidine kinase